MKSHRPSELPTCLTNALADQRGEGIRQAVDKLAAMMAEMLGVPCHVRISDDFAFVLIIREFSEADGEGSS